jgi:hypothetical protein
VSEARARWLVWTASVLLAAPMLVLRYLPMTDLPQYLAAGSILQHLHDPSWGYASYYEPAFGRTLSWLPYGLLRLLSLALPLELALRVVVFATQLMLPIAVAQMLSACGKPRLYALLMFPMVYSSQFYWGLIASNLSLSMALCACGLVMQAQRTLRQEVLLCSLGVAIAFTHAYGLSVLLVLAWLWLRRGRRSERQAWPWSLWPATLLTAPWLWFAARADAIGPGLNPALNQRLFLIGDNLLGGFAGPGELWLLLGLFGALGLLVWPVLPRSIEDWAAQSADARALWTLFALAAFAYLTLPLHTTTSVWINLRAAVLAMLLAPLLLPAAALRERTRLAISLPLIIACWTMLHAFVQLHAFDVEARDFDAIAAVAKPRARVVDFIQDAHGEVSGSLPYLQFGAYLLAQRGGYLGRDYFSAAWTLPIQVKPHPGIAAPGPVMLTSPEVSQYDELLVRGLDAHDLVGIGGFHHVLLAHSGAWSLYRPVAEPPNY